MFGRFNWEFLALLLEDQEVLLSRVIDSGLGFIWWRVFETMELVRRADWRGNLLFQKYPQMYSACSSKEREWEFCFPENGRRPAFLIVFHS